MRIEEVSVSVAPTEIELLLTALAYFEMEFIRERPENVLESMRMLRAKMLGTLRDGKAPPPTPDAPSESN